MILCDTNILIEFYKNNAAIVTELRSIGQSQLAISSITQAELYFGALNKRELTQLQQNLALLQVFPLTVAISQQFIQLMESYALSHRLSLPDALIAATAIEQTMPLYTLNLKDFQFIPRLILHQPTTY